MNAQFLKYCLVALMTAIPIGCEPRPVVVDEEPGAAETEVEIERDATNETTPPPTSGTGVDVNVGGEKGVYVNVNPGQSDTEDNR